MRKSSLRSSLDRFIRLIVPAAGCPVLPIKAKYFATPFPFFELVGLRCRYFVVILVYFFTMKLCTKSKNDSQVNFEKEHAQTLRYGASINRRVILGYALVENIKIPDKCYFETK